MEKTDNRVYELAYILVPTLSEQEAPAKFTTLQNLVEEKGGVAISHELPAMMDLAYEMNRIIDNKKTWFDTGYFGWTKFEAEPAAIAQIEAVLKRDETIIRYMIIKTVRENTMAPKKARTDKRRERSLKGDEVGESEEVAAPVDGVELDKQIDALVDENV